MPKRKDTYFVKIGRKGGKAVSARKIAAARKNGKKGGHPSLFK